MSETTPLMLFFFSSFLFVLWKKCQGESQGRPLAALRTALKGHPPLAQLATTPLMLQILIVAYQGTLVRQLPSKEKQLQKLIWTEYVQKMVKSKGDVTRYPLDSTITWLGWLAREMRSHNQPIFYLERLQPDRLPKRAQGRYRWSVGILIALGIIAFSQLSWMLVFWLPSSLFEGVVFDPIEGLLGAQPLALFLGLLGGVYFGLRPIRPLETLIWSWENIRSRFLVGLLLAMSGGTLLFFSKKLRNLTTNISEHQIPEHLRLSPNEGIRRSAKNGAIVGCLSLPIAGLFSGFYGMLHAIAIAHMGIRLGFIFGVLEMGFYGLTYALTLGLLFGLGAFVQHNILRFWLARSQSFPWKAVLFLEDATARTFLRRDSGGYSFIHRQLLDYFANLDTPPSLPLGDELSLKP